MDALVTALIDHPLYFIGALLSVLAVVGFLMFMRGFAAGVGNIFHMRGHVEHLLHARIFVVQGFFICMVVFGLWTIIRIIWGLAPLSHWLLAVFMLTPMWIPPLYKRIKKMFEGGGNGH